MSESKENNKESIYVIGFPKSGNTWLSRLLADALNSNINATNNIEASDNSKERKKGGYIIHKIHRSDNMEKIKQSKKVYIVRDPRAVMISSFFHNHRNLQDKNLNKNFYLKLFFEFEISNLNKSWNNSLPARRNTLRKIIKRLPRCPVGNWSEHVQYWSTLTDVVLVKYEDLLDNTESELSRILMELSVNYSENDIANIVNRQSFKVKKRNFEKNKDKENIKFMRTGKKDEWHELMSDNLIKKIENEHSDTMIKLNYQIS